MQSAKDLAYQDYLAGMKYKDIAEKHNVALSTVKSWASREWKNKKGCDQGQKRLQKVAEGLQPENDISWLEIETEYVTDTSRKPCSLKGLAAKYGVAPQTIYDYSAANDWAEKRKSYKETTKQKVVEKTSERISDEIAEATARHFNLSSRMLNVIEAALSDESELYKYVEVLRTGHGAGEFEDELAAETLTALNDKKLLNMVNSLDKLQKMQRVAIGALSPLERHKIAYDNKRLELEEKKAGSVGEDSIDDWVQGVVGKDE